MGFFILFPDRIAVIIFFLSPTGFANLCLYNLLLMNRIKIYGSIYFIIHGCYSYSVYWCCFICYVNEMGDYMKYITLNNGLQMPMIGLGVYQLQGIEGEDVILKAIKNGYRLFDTAQMYGNEQMVGKAIKKASIPREQLFITTKLYSPSNSYEKAKRDIDKSLRELQLDYIDLILIHEPYSHAIDMYKALEEAYEEGKIKAIGISNFNQKQYLNLLHHCHIIPAVNQVESHVFYTQKSLLELMNKHGTVMEAWSPLTADPSRIMHNDLLISIANKYNKTPVQISLKYLLELGIVIIPKTSHEERLMENIDLFDFQISESDMKLIETLNQGRSLFGW